jgi:hypothetical protein
MPERPRDIVVGSWSELCERVYDHSWQPAIGRFRSNYAYRGMADSSHDLRTSFARLCSAHPDLEYHLLRNFRKYSQLERVGTEFSDWRWLTIAQHYGLPSRLLDWTYSPFVAMHFATVDLDSYDIDGVIWQCDFVKINHMLPGPLIDALREVGSNTFTIEMLESAVPDLRTFDQLAGPNLVIFFEPPSVDQRIVNQFAFFSVISSATAHMHTWLKAHPAIYRRIIIPKELKWEVRDKLDQANITERTLFPGLDGLASWLTRHYTPKC